MPTPTTNPSIVDYLDSTKQDSSFAARTKLAADNGISNYTGTAEQNTSLLDTLRKNSAPVSTTPTDPLTKPNTGPITSSQLETATSMPDPVSLASDSQSTPSFSDQVSGVAKTVLTGNQVAIDNLRKEQEDLIAKQKADAQAKIDGVTNDLNTIKNSTQLSDKLDEINRQFDVPNQIKMLTDINSRIAQAQDALNVGLAYEADRPARQQIVSGRMNTLKTQGLATIGALQGAASVIQGNINLARSYAETTLGAIKDDNARSIGALNTLLNLYNNKLVDLTTEEHAVVKDRINALEDQVKQLDKDKGDIQDFMTKYPSAFLRGGVTLTDSKDVALNKMLPFLAKDEQLKLAKTLQAKSGGSGGGSAKDAAKDKTLLLQAKANGMPYHEAILAFADTLTPAYIDSIYPEESKKAKTIPSSSEDKFKDSVYGQLYNQAFDEQGNVKPGYSVTLDPKTGSPTITTPQSNGDTPGIWSRVKNVFTNNLR